MANPWFRLYSEFATDPKVQMLSEADQRRYLMLLCLRCSNDNETLHDDEIAFQLRIHATDWAATKAVLVAKNLIGDDSKPVAWEKRQYVSDSSTARVTAYRERVKNGVKQACNVSETPPDTETDTEEEQEKEPIVPSSDDTTGYSAEFDLFWSEYPKREGGNSKKGAYRVWKARLRDGVKAEDLVLSAKRYTAQMAAKNNLGTSYVKQAQTFLGPDEHWRESLNSNLHAFPGRTTAGGLEAGYFYHPDDNGLPPEKRRVRSKETHDETTGYTWVHMKKMGLA